ncbi:WcbI family polysaccharide biosynthesis putative acetyltransferase [Methylobacterium soli]|uniref:Polysaccharide biosynthesis enzyme WcbI domain-containing protein n=1 Tax=Methylobacterium soli TaxID=553447 RepID=A0A6L3SQ39_9HYPH|nr:WcbI family polysaccharide biosynthesis putative acetyltransferase [Methylobacterium soli]KAB1072884.1 hypothetical protein F6X53_27675 [Methylobacterium soli]
MTKISIIGNCQSHDIGRAVRLGSEIVVDDWIDVSSFGTEWFEQKTSEILSKNRVEGLDIVTQTIKDARFENLNTAELKSQRSRIHTMTNMWFTGLHPDMTYLGGFKERIVGPLGDYHSKIVVGAFLAGLTQSECNNLFNGRFFEKVGLFDEFKQSSIEALGRDDGNDIKAATEILDACLEVPCFYTINHPTAAAVDILAGKICHYFENKYVNYDSRYYASTLATGTWWPLYPEIKEVHKIKYHTPMAFKQADGDGGRMLTLVEFIEHSYASYGSYGIQAMRSTEQGEHFKNLIESNL